MRKYIYSLLMLFIFNSVNAIVISIDRINYELNDDKTATIYSDVYVSSSYLRRHNPDTTIIIPQTIYYEGEEYVVTKIRGGAFSNSDYGESHVRHLQLPETIDSIGGGAFYKCTALVDITTPTGGINTTYIGKNTFMGCSNLQSLPIFNELQTIEYAAFESCSLPYISFPKIKHIKQRAFIYSGLKEVDLSDSLEIIESNAFWLSKLTKVTIGASTVKEAGDDIFYGCPITDVYWNAKTWPDAPPMIRYSDPDYVFHKCDYLGNFIFGDSVRHIPAHLLDNTTQHNIGDSGMKYMYVSISEGVETIGDSAFYNHAIRTIYWKAIDCKSHGFGDYNYNDKNLIKHRVVLGDKVESIPNYFGWFTTLQSYFAETIIEDKVPKSLKTIGISGLPTGKYESINLPNIRFLSNNAILGTINSIYLGDSLLHIGSAALSGYKGSTIHIPKNVQYCGENAFYADTVVWNSEKCDTICNVAFRSKYLVLGDSLERIPVRLCYENDSLQSIRFTNNKIKEIPEKCFCYCTNLKDLDIPDGVNTIGYGAFGGTGLVNLNLSESVQVIDSSAFAATKLEKLLLPNSVKVIRKSAFYNCRNLETVTFGLGIDSIYVSAFRGCEPEYNSWADNPIERYLEFYFTSSNAPYVEKGAFGYYGMYSLPTSDPNNPMIRRTNVRFYVPCKENYKEKWNPLPWTKDEESTIYYYSFDDIVYQYNPYKFTIVQPDDKKGKISINKYGSGCNDYVYTISANAKYGYQFSEWSDGVTDNPRDIKVQQDTSFTAFFTPLQYTLNVYSDSLQCSTSGGGVYDYLEKVWIEAIPAEEYRFIQWSDGNTSNPRQITMESDTSFTAMFKSIYINLIISSDSNGMVSGVLDKYKYLDTVVVEAIPNYGYDFSKWSDGVYNNPRRIIIRDWYENEEIKALFTPKTYHIEYGMNMPEAGWVSGYTSAKYLTEIDVRATARYGYTFVEWSNGSTDNPMKLVVTSDTTITAIFALDKFDVTLGCNHPNLGSVTGGGSYEYNTTITIEAIPAANTRFIRWSDGNTDNPREIVVDRNLTLTAEFETFSDFSTDCLNYRLNHINKTATVTGISEQACSDRIVVPREVYSNNEQYIVNRIGDRVFSRKDNLYAVILPETIDTLDNRVFLESRQLTEIVLKSIIPPTLTTPEYMFWYVPATIIVPCGTMNDYKEAWGDEIYNRGASSPLPSIAEQPMEYALNITSSNPEIGTLTIDRSKACTEGSITASVSVNHNVYPSHNFIRWSDGNTDNPRTIMLNHNIELIAEIEEVNTYTVLFDYDHDKCSMSWSTTSPVKYMWNSQTNEYGAIMREGETITFEIKNINEACRFVAWNDGNTATKREYEVHQDMTFSPELYCYDTDIEVGCLKYHLDIDNQTATITGYTEECSDKLVIPSVVYANNREYFVTRLNDRVFYESKFYSITIPESVKSLGEGAFCQSYDLTELILLSATPPTLEGGHIFWYVPGTIKVPCGLLDTYIDAWGGEIYNRGADAPLPRIAEIPTDLLQYKWNFTVNNPDYGEVVVDESQLCETNSITLTANAWEWSNAYFIKWSDDNTENPRTIFISNSIELMAIFSEIEAGIGDVVDDTSKHSTQGYPIKYFEDGQVYILLPDGRRYDLQGAEIR